MTAALPSATAAAGAAAASSVAEQAATAPTQADAFHHVMEKQMLEVFALANEGRGKEAAALANAVGQGKVFHVRIERAADQAVIKLDQGQVKEAIDAFEAEVKQANDDGMETVIRASMATFMYDMRAMGKIYRPVDKGTLFKRIDNLISELDPSMKDIKRVESPRIPFEKGFVNKFTVAVKHFDHAYEFLNPAVKAAEELLSQGNWEGAWKLLGTLGGHAVTKEAMDSVKAAPTKKEDVTAAIATIKASVDKQERAYCQDFWNPGL
jgi:hypothetical protein